MVTLLLLTWLQVAPTQPAPSTPPPAPVRTQPARPKAQTPPPAAGTTVNFTVTDGVGAVLEGVTVSLVGVADREGQTTAEGRLRMLNVPAGTYRVRFEREGFYTFEKEVIWRTGWPRRR